jgi:hypothetical protein
MTREKREIPMNEHEHDYVFDHHCGAEVCLECDDHRRLFRCFCGWSRSGRDGRQELIEMGETIEDSHDYPSALNDEGE